MLGEQLFGNLKLKAPSTKFSFSIEGTIFLFHKLNSGFSW